MPEILNVTEKTVQKSIPKFLAQNIIKKTSKMYTDEYMIVNKILQKTLYDELDYPRRIEIHKRSYKRCKS